RMARAWLALEAGDAAGARQELDFIRGEFRTSAIWPELRRLEARADIQAGQPGLALGRLRSVTSRLRDFPPASRRATERLRRRESWLQLALGNSAEVGRLMAGSNGGGPGGLLRAWAHLMGRNPAGALRAALPQLESEQPRIRHAALLAVVASRLQDGGTSGLADPLAELAGLHETYGLRLAANWLPGPDRDRVAAAAAERGWNLGIDGQARPVFPGDIVVVILSDRERVVLAELARTGSAAEIAARQFVSANTVKSQLRSLYRKLDAANREDALGAAVRYGLLEPAHPAGAAERNGAGNRG
ncbi:helix-turn-helix transcriptional regulator, partial [Arthrobacter deserti]|nr:helix-turn-helix transcriptional regulator [Arthrobacter deserti]